MKSGGVNLHSWNQMVVTYSELEITLVEDISIVK